MDARLTMAVAASKLAAFLLRKFRLGGGTTLPGEIARRIDPLALEKMAAGLPYGSLLVTGTNGKTTTSRMLAQILRCAGRRPVHNRAGANLLRGIAAALADDAHLGGQPRADTGLFEVDEAVFPAAQRALRPSVVVLTNLFRDQLDRYGEVDFVAKIWGAALAELRPEAAAVLNADDPLVAGLGRKVSSAPVLYYGVEDESCALPSLPHAADAKVCLACGGRYDYQVAYYGHLGKYRCPSCGLGRPKPQVRAVGFRSGDAGGSEIRLVTPQGEVALRLRVPGLYNLYNALAAASAACALGLDLAAIREGLEGFEAAFGRLERVAVGGKELFLALIKNPVGCNEVVRTILADPQPKNLFILINDKLADGTDVSWLWDADFEALAGRVRFVVTSGTRAEDMAVRLKYALIEEERILCQKGLEQALRLAWEKTPPGETLYVLPTYTAMLELRALLRRRGWVGPFWED